MGYYIVMILSWILTIYIAYIVIRKATRSDDQVYLLREIVAGQDKIIKALTSQSATQTDKPEVSLSSNQKSDDEYLRDARSKAGLS